MFSMTARDFMKKTLIFLLITSTFCFSYTQDFIQSMDLYWNMYHNDETEKADKYLTYLIQSEYTPNVDKINYMMYKQIYLYQIGDEEAALQNKKLMDALCDFDPICLEEKQKNWGRFIYDTEKY